jgi:hypothetical protein
MHPPSVTIGARLGRRLNVVIAAAAVAAPDKVAFFGGVIASIVGAIAGHIGNAAAANLLRIALERLDGQPQLELPPSVRLQIAAAEETLQRGATTADAVRADETLGGASILPDEPTEEALGLLAVYWPSADRDQLREVYTNLLACGSPAGSARFGGGEDPGRPIAP